MSKETLESLIPQRAPMLLLDEIVSNKDGKLTTKVTITKNTLGFDGEGVPAWFGIEYMAQTVAAYNALNLSDVKRPEIGFLVGARAYKCVDKFLLNDELLIVANVNFFADASGSFDCEIHCSGNVIATGTLATYKPSQEMINQLWKT